MWESCQTWALFILDKKKGGSYSSIYSIPIINMEIHIISPIWDSTKMPAETWFTAFSSQHPILDVDFCFTGLATGSGSRREAWKAVSKKPSSRQRLVNSKDFFWVVFIIDSTSLPEIGNPKIHWWIWGWNKKCLTFIFSSLVKRWSIHVFPFQSKNWFLVKWELFFYYLLFWVSLWFTSPSHYESSAAKECSAHLNSFSGRFHTGTRWMWNFGLFEKGGSRYPPENYHGWLENHNFSGRYIQMVVFSIVMLVFAGSNPLKNNVFFRFVTIRPSHAL